MSTRTASILHNAAVDQEGRHLGFFGYQPGQPMVVVFNAEIPTGITAIQALGLLFEKILFPFCPSDPDRRRSRPSYRRSGAPCQNGKKLSGATEGSGHQRKVKSVNGYDFEQGKDHDAATIHYAGLTCGCGDYSCPRMHDSAARCVNWE